MSFAYQKGYNSNNKKDVEKIAKYFSLRVILVIEQPFGVMYTQNELINKWNMSVS